jgi:hypothetical protein
MLDQMIRIGHKRSNENLAALQPVFFHALAMHPFVPFPDMGPPAAPQA